MSAVRESWVWGRLASPLHSFSSHRSVESSRRDVVARKVEFGYDLENYPCSLKLPEMICSRAQQALLVATAQNNASKTNTFHFSLLFSRHNHRISTPTVTHHSPHHSTPFRTTPIGLRAESRYFLSNPMDRQFPPEVVLLIVEASLDPYDSFDMLDDHIPRYSTLCNYSRLNSVWRNISKPLLYESVVLMTDRAEEDLLSVLGGDGGKELEMIKALSIRMDQGDTVVTEALLDHLQDRVETLSLDGVEFALARGGQNLRRLLLHEIDVRDDPESRWTPNVAFPQLHYLQIERSPTDIALPPHHFPLLRSLYSDDTIDPPEQGLCGRLTTLHVHEPRGFESLLPRASNLLLLSISLDYYEEEIFPFLHHIPRFLRIESQMAEHAIEAFKYQLESKRDGLEIIFWDDEDDPYDRSKSSQWNQMGSADLIGDLAKKGVEVIRGKIGFRNAVERMEAILAKEKRAEEDKERRARKW